jgi:hypothetical protein
MNETIKRKKKLNEMENKNWNEMKRKWLGLPIKLILSYLNWELNNEWTGEKSNRIESKMKRNQI